MILITIIHRLAIPPRIFLHVLCDQYYNTLLYGFILEIWSNLIYQESKRALAILLSILRYVWHSPFLFSFKTKLRTYCVADQRLDRNGLCAYGDNTCWELINCLRSFLHIPIQWAMRNWSTLFQSLIVLQSASFLGLETWVHHDVIKWKHFPRYWLFVREFTGPRWIPRTKASDAELWYFLWSAPE